MHGADRSAFHLGMRIVLFSFVVWLVAARLAFPLDARTPSLPAGKQLPARYGAVPLTFERNQGQADGSVRFLSHGPGFSAYFKDHEASLWLSRSGSDTRASDGIRRASSKSDVVRLSLPGASAGSRLSGEATLPGTVNYFIGSDPAAWRTGIPLFETVKYDGVYPGVNLVYYGSGRRLEFDLEAAPGADIGRIRVKFDGARKLSLDPAGNLIISASHGDIRFDAPVVYQLDADHRQQRIEGRFRLVSRNTVGFVIASYDRSRALVIDPILNYSTYLGASGGATAIAVNAAGEAYIAGQALSGMPASGFQTAPAKKSNPAFGSAFVAKLNSAGTALLYCTYLSGSGNDAANAIALDSNGNAFVAGQTSSADFPTTKGALQVTNKAGVDNTGAANPTGFVTALNSTGTALTYSTYLGGTNLTVPTAIALDTPGNAYLTGYTVATDYPTTSGAFQSLNKASTATAFVSKLNTSGTGLVYSTYLGGGTLDEMNGLAVDSNGNAYVVGSSESTDFPTTPGAFQTINKTYPVGRTAVVTKLDPTGASLVYSTYLGGMTWETAWAIAVDGSGSAYVAGETTSTDFPITPGAFQERMNIFGGVGGSTALITKFDASASSIEYSTYLGGTQTLESSPPCIEQNLPYPAVAAGLGIVLDGVGNAIVAGVTNQIDFPVTAGALETTNRAWLQGCDEGSFLSKIDTAGSKLLYSSYFSGSGDGSGMTQDYTHGIAMDKSGNVYLAGQTVSTDFPTTPGAFQISPGGAFVTQFNASEMGKLPVPTIAISSNLNLQTPASPVTFQVQVKPVSGKTPTGVFAFSYTTGPALYDGQDYAWSPWTFFDLDASGSATFTPSGWSSVPSYVSVYYLGDANNSAASLTTQTVSTNPALPMAISISATPNPAAYGAPVVFHISVSDPAKKGIPAGSVMLSYIYDPNTTISFGSGTLDGTGAASITASGLPPGTDTMRVGFSPANKFYNTGTATYNEVVTALGTTPAPLFSPGAGSYANSQAITISDADSNAAIYYSTNGAIPDQYSQAYSGPIQVSTCDTIHAIAIAPGYLPSAVSSASYSIGGAAGSTTTQANEWAWITGGCQTVSGIRGVYGQLGVAAAGNSPGARLNGGQTWTDKNGSLWLVGGFGFDSVEALGYLNDVWRFDPTAKVWAWMGGSKTVPASCPVGAGLCAPPGVYGAFQTAAQGNVPGGRSGEVVWIDSSGNLWLFGGYGADSTGQYGYLNDLWEFHPSVNQWAWMAGSSTASSGGTQGGVYGTLGKSGAGNTPGDRTGEAVWTDSNGNLWLFGGQGPDSSGMIGDLNDLWKFDVAGKQWAWMGGVSAIPQSDPIMCGPCSAPGVYGTQGTLAAGNIPRGRTDAGIWTDAKGNVWLFGGNTDFAYNTVLENYGSELTSVNDLWEFVPSTNQWAWIAGVSPALSDGILPGSYGTLGAPAVGNTPGGRTGETTWTDSGGNLWLWGGNGFDSTQSYGLLNDVWKFDTVSKQWAWMGGGSLIAAPGTYGTLRISSIENVPGARSGEDVWEDKTGNLWLFGGMNPGFGELNDLWVYSPSANEWAWMGGSNSVPGNGQGVSGMYGAPGMFASTNMPGARSGALRWTDGGGNLWLFGGYGFDSAGNLTNLADVWEYVPSAPGATPSFAFSAAPSSITIAPGGTVSTTLTTVAAGGFASAIALAASGAPSGVTVSFSPTSITGAGAATMTISADATAASSFTPIAVTGTSGSIAATTNVSLTIGSNVSPLPTFVPGTGSYSSAVPVTIQCNAQNCTIYYAVNGTPTTNSAKYTGPVTMSSSGTLSAIAVESGFTPSAVASATYAIDLTSTAAPTFNPAAGTYTSTQSVTLGDATPGATIYYTTDGSTPTTNSAVYSALINVSSTETLKAIAAASGYSLSGVATAAYTINLPGFSIAGTALSVAPGATTGNTSTITLTPSNGFSGVIKLSCTITPTAASDPATCSLPATATISGSAAQTATLTVNTTSASAALNRTRTLFRTSAGAAILACILLIGIPAGRRKWWKILGMLLLLFIAVGSGLGCEGGGSGGGGGGGNPGTTPGTYTITVTGNSGAITQTGTVSLTVQ